VGGHRALSTTASIIKVSFGSTWVQRCGSSELVWTVENPHILPTWVNRLIIDEFGGWAKYQALLRAMRNVADRHSTASGCTIAMVAMAWVLAQEGVGAIIVGMYACGGTR
jgi:hypothetical protein